MATASLVLAYFAAALVIDVLRGQNRLADVAGGEVVAQEVGTIPALAVPVPVRNPLITREREHVEPADVM